MIERYLQSGLRLFYKGNLKPLYLIHFITGKCNAKCKHCFYWQSLNKQDEQTMSLEEIDKMTKTMGKLLFVNLTGGEPFLRKDIVDIAKIYYKNTKPINITIPTNGILTKKILENAEEILKSCPKTKISIKFSIDGTKMVHDEIRGFSGIFKCMVETYKALNKLKKKYSNLDIYMTTVVSKMNHESLDELYDFMKENLKDNTWLVLLARGDTKDSTAKDFDVEVYKRFADKVKKNFKNNSGLLVSNLLEAKDRVSDEIIHKTAEEKRFLMPCYAGRTACVIDENGNIDPCEILDDTFGNIRDYNYDFGKLWTNRKAKKIRNDIIETKCFCTHECFVGNNIMFNIKMWPKIISKLIKKD